MNESEKNIETCLPENILAEVASVPTDPQFVSLVEESFDPMQQQAVQQAGSDAYNEVVASHQPYTFTLQVKQMKSNLILLLRRFWRFPFGSGTIRSLSDMWQHYITRLQGSETYGIPSRLDQLTDLPSAPLLVADRKISGADVEDGMSLQHILGSDEGLAAVANLSDNNEWVMNRGISFPNVNRIENNAQSFFKEIDPAYTIFGGQHKELILPNMEWTTYPAVVRDGSNTYNRYNRHTLSQSTVLETLYAPKLRGVSWIVNGAQGLEVLSLPELEFIGISGYGRPAAIHNCANLKEINLPKLSYLQGWYSFGGIWANCPKLEKVVLGTLHQWYLNDYNDRTYNSEYLVHLEIGAGTDCSLNFGWWSPTLDSSNLQQFLSNFRSFIVLRLANRKSTTALTLTLSAAVYNAVTGANSGWASQHTLAELGITDNDLTDLETELGITSATIYATWLDTFTGANGIHWDINKAN